MHQNPLTEQSPLGRYYVITLARTLYVVLIVSHDDLAAITRYPAGTLPGEGEILRSVSSFRFDETTGHGAVLWWKLEQDEGHGRTYGGTLRTSSRVMHILHEEVVEPTAPGSQPPAASEDIVAQLLTSLSQIQSLPALELFVEALRRYS